MATTLLAVTGLSPQVVTETLYGIYQGGLEWPSSIKVITTQKGKQQIRLGLILSGHLKQLCADYNLPEPTFEESDILVVPAADGSEVDDARTLEDQEALADFITSVVANLSQEKNTIHASIAGGRKTMTFFLGYAMTIFARPEDRLSHVLVSSDYESVSDFYYPTPFSKKVTGRDGSLLDAKDAKVMLAEIPFISQRIILGDAQIKDFTNLKYNELISAIQLVQNPDQVHLQFIINRSKPKLLVNNQVIDFSERKSEFAFYAMCLRQRDLENDYPVQRPTSEEQSAILTGYYYSELGLLIHREYSVSDEDAFLNELIDSDVLSERTVAALKESGVSAKFFDTRKTQLQDHLRKSLPAAMVNLIMPGIVRTADGVPLQRGQRAAQGGQYGSWLKPEQITFSS